MDNLCRVCRQTGENTPLKSMMISGLLEIYSFCTDIPISEDNEKFYKICEQCAELLIRFEEFKKLCIESDSYFKQNACIEVKLELLGDPLNETPFVKDEQFYDSDHFDDNHENENDELPNLHKRSKPSKSQSHCKYCLKKFVYVASLKKHYLKCSQSVDQDEEINTDLKISKEEIKEEISDDELPKKFVCPTCNKEFSKPQNYKVHLRVHSGEKPYECLQCDKKYRDSNTLKAHIQKIHLKTQEYSCHFCPKLFFTMRDLKMHIRTHTKEFQCNLCFKKFSLKCNLEKHLKNHESKINKCRTCKQIFDNKPDYRNHILTHMEDNPYKCKICETDFVYLNSFKKHVKENHPEKQNEECIENPQQLLSGNGALNESLPSRITPVKRKSPPPDAEKKHICNFCGKRFMTNYNLEDHIRVHTGEKPFPCDKCDFKGSNKGRLRLHQQRMHEKMPRYSCSYCSYKTYTNDRLARHITSHFDEKPFVCDVCNAAYKMRKSLIVHKRTHTGERPFQCTFCEKAFTSSTYLNCHLSIHTGEKKFVCKICDKKFTQRGPLAKHMELHKNGNKSLKF